MSNETNDSFEASWWLHIVGILIFHELLVFSKHSHLLLAFKQFCCTNPDSLIENQRS
jgi:hypothetical protein